MKVFVVFAFCLVAVAAGPDEDAWLRFNRRMPGAYYSMMLQPSENSSYSGRIVGGVDARIEDFPYQLSLIRSGSHICGASVISDRWALSAAHCTYPVPELSSVTLRGGSNNRLEGGVLFEVNRIENHPLYNDWRAAHDVSLLHSTTYLVGPNIAAVTLASVNAYIPAGTRAVVSGWGYTSGPQGTLTVILQRALIPVVDQMYCMAAWPAGWVTDDMLCASELGRDACNGDSGGPLVTGGVQIGAVSWGSGDCIGDRPGVYVRIGFPIIRNWIFDISGV
ncbi:trypsin-7-like [Sabethes cyaneus]|uniref:trypsin-7-like n=1 Tax=Sabethes cyaneus TaxID=53552 RepID=UPI00237E3D5E|nr:trypsin-7-like [Sabethes cyaneus]